METTGGEVADGPTNLGNPHEITIRELAETIIDLTGSSSEIVFRPLPPIDPLQRCPDIARAERLLKWRPTTDLADGLAATIAYFDEMLRAAPARV